ncbi:MAG: cytochrome c nitrite reductase small subunit [Verrucomicrobia bacterium]|nr:cytochrome c nitrite reductase small subunit [Verrucomicrobiota bacterium]
MGPPNGQQANGRTRRPIWARVALLAPPPRWRMPVAIALGVFAGVVLLLVHTSRATSYLSDKPEVCINCHVMEPECAGWTHGSHHTAATCSDCHLPHDNLVHKYIVKGRLGTWHAWVFTWNTQPQAIRPHALSVNTVQANCIRCHDMVVNSTRLVERPEHASWAESDALCARCHRDVGHGHMNSLASGRVTLAPKTALRVPAWLREIIYSERDRAE